ncbi:hypothetical protein AMEX_G6135, partial [Astyanax mexicanus]
MNTFEKKIIQRLHKSTKLKDKSYIGWLRQVHCKPGGHLHAKKALVLQLDEEKKRAAKFCLPRWPPIISIMLRERRKRARRELEWVQAVQASASKLPRSRPDPRSGGTESRGGSQFCPPHWPPVISQKEMMKRSWFLRELERARLAQAKKRRRRASKPAKVTRATVWRRKRSLEEDKKVLQKIRYVYTQKPPGILCHLCGQPRRMEFGHVTYKGKSFCSTASGQSAPDWLAEQKWVDGSCRGRNVPRTTAWNTQKRRQREQEAEEFGVRL